MPRETCANPEKYSASASEREAKSLGDREEIKRESKRDRKKGRETKRDRETERKEERESKREREF